VSTASEQHELRVFLRNLQEGLKKYTLAEFNDSISSIVTDKKGKKREQKLKVDCVITEICNEFNLSREELLKGRGKGIVQTARKYTYCILHNDLELPIRHIAKNIFAHQWHTSVSVVINYSKTLNLAIKSDREFAEKLNFLRSRIDEKINNVML